MLPLDVRTALILTFLLGSVGLAAAAPTTLVNANLTLELPAGWTYVQAGTSDHLSTPGQADVDITVDARVCADRPATSATPVWIKPNVWPFAEAVPGGVTLCIQRDTDSLAILVRDNAADPLVAAVADKVNPPVTVGPLVVRFPFFTIAQVDPAEPKSTDVSAFLAVRSSSTLPAGIQLTVRTVAAHCSDEFPASLAPEMRKPSTVAQPDWSPYAFEWPEGRGFCLELREGILIAKYIKGVDTGMPVLLEMLRVQALATFGAPTIYNASTPGTLPAFNRVLPRATWLGEWKQIDATTAGFNQGDGFMGLDNPYSVIVVRECINGTTKLSAADMTKVFPPSGDGAFSMSSENRWIGTQCVRTVFGNFTVMVIGPNGSTEIIADGLAQVRSLVAVVETALGTSPVTPVTPVTPVDNGGTGGDPSLGTFRRALPVAAYVNGGLATFEATPLRDRYLAPFVAADTRITHGVLTCDIGLMLGRGGDEFIGEIRTMFGLNLPLQVANISVLGGAGVGSIGPGASVDVAVEGSVALYTAESSMLLVRGMRAWGIGGADHDELELRVLLSSKREDNFANAVFLGFRYIKFGPSTVEDENLNDVMVPNGHALLFSIGFGGLAAAFDAD